MQLHNSILETHLFTDMGAREAPEVGDIPVLNAVDEQVGSSLSV